ncbi:SpoIVB peptidase S55 domain-containing protein [Nocardioides dongkuii]|uniref:SpoIVB peptidase S55 domain-containing protein n=1 Tax=Nocardioides dongkuii TaxID=2760089 RepID=UPI0015FDB1A2|nr:SpoIVB peptidase S55 domain-containing protein [Nocardioides dongkuii]
MTLPTRRRRLLSLATAATLMLGLPALGATVLAGPASSADPAADCVAPYPVSELAAGDAVDGLTVVRGTTPTGFTGEVLGVLEDGIGPDLDMVMVELDMPEFDRTGGIWQGMSGSPVYAEDGRLIGAVAYGLAYGPSPIAGITPFEEMDTYLADPAKPDARIPLGRADARTVAARAGISPAQAERGFRELPMPLGVTGVSARRLAQAQAKGSDFLEKASYVLGRSEARAAGPETMVAGGNLGVSGSHGDVTMASVGTVTSVCAGRVVGFGHPMGLFGTTTMGLHPADAVYVQPDSLGAPFKVANIAPVTGTVTEDRLTGVTGAFGAAPAAIEVVSHVAYAGRSRTGASSVSLPELAADVTFYQLMSNQDRVLDGPARGSELLSWTIEGTEDGTPFSLGFTDRYTGSDLSFEPAYSVAEVVSHLSYLDGVTLSSVEARATVDDDLTTHTVGSVQQLRRGEWVPVSRKAPVIAKAGRNVRIRVLLKGSAGRLVLPVDPIAVPKRAAGRLVLQVQGGGSSWSSASGRNVTKVAQALADQQRRDEVRIQFGSPEKIMGGYDEDFYEEFYLRGPAKPGKPRGVSFVRESTLGPLDHVVDGVKQLRVVVR